MEKKLVIENEKNETEKNRMVMECLKLIGVVEEGYGECGLLDEINSEIDNIFDEFAIYPDGFNRDSFKRIEYELSQIENGCDVISVFEQEGIKLNVDVIDSFKKTALNPSISSNNLNELFSKMNGGEDSAKEQITKVNQVLVALAAKEYYINHDKPQGVFDIRRLDLSFEELIKIGNTGLEKAIKMFDCRHGHKFSPYALLWVCSAFEKAVADSLEIPVHMVDTVKRIYQTVHQDYIELGRKPTAREIAEKLGMSEDGVSKVLDKLHAIML